MPRRRRANPNHLDEVELIEREAEESEALLIEVIGHHLFAFVYFERVLARGPE
jgi:hypothetical protein